MIGSRHGVIEAQCGLISHYTKRFTFTFHCLLVQSPFYDVFFRFTFYVLLLVRFTVVLLIFALYFGLFFCSEKLFIFLIFFSLLLRLHLLRFYEFHVLVFERNCFAFCFCFFLSF